MDAFGQVHQRQANDLRALAPRAWTGISHEAVEEVQLAYDVMRDGVEPFEPFICGLANADAPLFLARTQRLLQSARVLAVVALVAHQFQPVAHLRRALSRDAEELFVQDSEPVGDLRQQLGMVAVHTQGTQLASEVARLGIDAMQRLAQ
jgi:hypothetical protein